MHSALTPIEYAEASILLLGTLIILGGAVRITLRREWGKTLSLPSVARSDVQGLDLLVAGWAFFFIPYLFSSAALGLTGAAPTTQPAELGPQTPALVAARSAGQVVNCCLFLLIGYYRYGADLAAWGLTARSIGRQFARAVVIYIGFWPICFGVLQLMTRPWLMRLLNLEQLPEHPAIETMKDPNTPAWITVATIVGAAVLVPIYEELFFRGLLFTAMSRALNSPRRALFYSSLAFGLIHYPTWQNIPSLALFGLVLGFVYAKTRSLTLVILIHAVFNGKTILWLMLGAAA